MNASDLDKALENIKREREKVLICWDAPLTGPTDCSNWTYQQGDLTQRPIDKLFTKKADRIRKKEAGRDKFDSLAPPRGITVMGYGSCFHWSISRALLGLPRVGRFDQARNLPFELCEHEGKRPQGNKKFVVEVHPALALWLWFREESGDRIDWSYKNIKKAKKKDKEHKKKNLEWLAKKHKERLAMSVIRSLKTGPQQMTTNWTPLSPGSWANYGWKVKET